MRDLDKALADILAIRSQIAAGTAFRGGSSPCRVGLGSARSTYATPRVMLGMFGRARSVFRRSRFHLIAHT